MSTLAIRAVLALGLLAGAYAAGDRQRNNAWLAQQSAAVQAANLRFNTEAQRADNAVAALATRSRQLQSNQKSLAEKFNELSQRNPLFVAEGGAGACASDPPAGADTPATAQAPGARPPAEGRQSVLTAGAVWMWNSALAGADQPAGACGAASTAQAACAAASPITLADAWANHAANAQTCLEDRLAHQSLIDFIQQQQAQSPTAP